MAAGGARAQTTTATPLLAPEGAFSSAAAAFAGSEEEAFVRTGRACLASAAEAKWRLRSTSSMTISRCKSKKEAFLAAHARRASSRFVRSSTLPQSISPGLDESQFRPPVDFHGVGRNGSCGCFAEEEEEDGATRVWGTV